mmetsp:Transcript_46872/g.116843  ORF Transcript_46872/g.116843 Transcript_46872/m.116843 type:complete len:92 (+) Transcript_46872:126-401(+)
MYVISLSLSRMKTIPAHAHPGRQPENDTRCKSVPLYLLFGFRKTVLDSQTQPAAIHPTGRSESDSRTYVQADHTQCSQSFVCMCVSVATPT